MLLKTLSVFLPLPLGVGGGEGLRDQPTPTHNVPRQILLVRLAVISCDFVDRSQVLPEKAIHEFTRNFTKTPITKEALITSQSSTTGFAADIKPTTTCRSTFVLGIRCPRRPSHRASPTGRGRKTRTNRRIEGVISRFVSRPAAIYVSQFNFSISREILTD